MYLKNYGYDRESGKVTVSNRPDFANINVMEHYLMQRNMKKHHRVIAEEVVEKLNENKIFSKLEIAAPGFINITINDEFLIDYINKMNKDE